MLFLIEIDKEKLGLYLRTNATNYHYTIYVTVSVNRVEACLMERFLFGLKSCFINVIKWSVKERKE